MKKTITCFFLLFIFFVSSIAQAQAEEIVWAPQQRITNSPTQQSMPAIALDQQDNVHMAWLDNVGTQEQQIVYRKFDKYGAPLTNEIQLTSGAMRSRVNELISVDPNGNIILVYSDYTSIIFRKFNNVGQPLTPEIPPFYTLVMQEREILAEKIRAIMARNKARDLFDAFALIEKGTEVDSDLIGEKLKHYSLEFSKKELSEAIDKKQNLWAHELKHLLNEAPSFIDVKRKVLSVF